VLQESGREARLAVGPWSHIAQGVRLAGDAGDARLRPTPPRRSAACACPAGVDNAKLEARADVLTYATAVLDHDVEVVGEVGAEIWFRSSLHHDPEHPSAVVLPVLRLP
jgi:hypothetical protein